jgi:hypothetical protein
MKRDASSLKIGRRQALKGMLAGAASVALADRLGLPALAAPRPPKAKSVIQIWMWGGPCHIDTFDPKPEAGSEYCGPLDKAIGTNVSGIRIGQSLPLLAKQADKYSIIRSMTHGINSHETASYMTQTGREPGRFVYPCAGAVVSKFKGYDGGYKGIVPPYIVLTQAQGRFSEAGFLGQRYKPFATGGDPNREPFAVEGLVVKGITDKRQRSRRSFLRSLDSLGRAAPEDATVRDLDKCEREAYEMMFGEARKIFDLSQETDETREGYGRTQFGQACLAARRLVERGVPYVTINYKGWDTHKQHFNSMRRLLPELDRGMSTLLADLSERGLLDTTVVWWGGEFGRTPKVQYNPPWNGGRGHFGACFSSVVAGGGFRGGQVVGASNATGTEVADRPVYPADLIGSIYELMGIDPEGALSNPRGMDVKVLSAKDGKLKTGGRLKEIL